MWLRLQNSMQRYSEPSFFLINKTSTPYKEKVGWMKPVLRFFSINSLKASCSDAEREYIEPTRG